MNKSWRDGPHPYQRWLIQCDCNCECNCNSDPAIDARMKADGIEPSIFHKVISELADYWGNS